MLKLEDIKKNAVITGLEPDQVVRSVTFWVLSSSVRSGTLADFVTTRCCTVSGRWSLRHVVDASPLCVKAASLLGRYAQVVGRGGVR